MEPTIGEIRIFAGNFAPRGWALCEGQLIAISSNQALFSILGTTYGGDGRTTFGLPELRGRVAVHEGSGPGLSTYALGQKGGSESATLTEQQLPPHNHVLNGYNASGNQPNPGGHSIAGSIAAGRGTVDAHFSNNSPDAAMKPGSVNGGGGNQPHNNIQPSLAVNFIICLFGVFPSRN